MNANFFENSRGGKRQISKHATTRIVIRSSVQFWKFIQYPICWQTILFKQQDLT